MNTITETALWLACGGAIGLFLSIAILFGAVWVLVNFDDWQRAKDRDE